MSIAGSQSRYVLQQLFYCNVKKLKIDAINRYGVVDSAAKTSILKTVAHPLIRQCDLGQFTVSNAPTLILDYFATGSHALQSPNFHMFKNSNSQISPEWNQKFWIAIKFESHATPTSSVLFKISDTTSLNDGYRLHQLSNGTIFAQIRTIGSTKRKRIVSPSVNDGGDRVAVVVFGGTDDANDWEMYFNMVPVTFSIDTNDLLAGETIFPSGNDTALDFGGNAGSYSNGYFGGVMCGFGEPNLQSIQNELQ